jgi:hypothetical protein
MTPALVALLGFVVPSSGSAPAATLSRNQATVAHTVPVPRTVAALPGPAPAESSSPPQSPRSALPDTGAREWAISIDTIGYQAEIDQCLWVRMDLGAPAPVVGAHNYCGGAIVLDMRLGDRVALSGAGLDGTYTVVASRDAHAGDNGAEATAGLVADVILQTCYWHANGLERLVALRTGSAAAG